jgi:hypothetical protein
MNPPATTSRHRPPEQSHGGRESPGVLIRRRGHGAPEHKPAPDVVTRIGAGRA